MSNNVLGPNGPLFDYSSQPTAATPVMDGEELPETYDPMLKPDKAKEKSPRIPDADLEGALHDPTITKVVDRRWYELNKHIYPASVWEEYTPDKDFSNAKRKDANGNSFFFS